MLPPFTAHQDFLEMFDSQLQVFDSCFDCEQVGHWHSGFWHTSLLSRADSQNPKDTHDKIRSTTAIPYRINISAAIKSRT
jgi:hypothetical protein